MVRLRSTWAEVDLGNLVHNFQVMREAVGSGTAIMPTVKADAYGHGAIECSLALQQAGADCFGVALPEEGAKLRRAGIVCPILCLGGFGLEQVDTILRYGLTPVAYRVDMIEALDFAAAAAGRIVEYHLKVDTGMGRLGIPFVSLDEFLNQIACLNNVKLDGVMTHLAAADEKGKLEFTLIQMDRFNSAVEMVRSRGHIPRWIHQANTAATHALPQSRYNLVRLGGALYGLWRDVVDNTIPPFDWKQVLSLHTRINLIKTVSPGTPLGYGCTYVTEHTSRIATLPIGYEDGLRRALSNKGKVIVRGRYTPIVGRISMDLTMIDVTSIPDAEVGDEVVIIGSQGDSCITSEEMAEQLDTISYEVTCGISERVPRLYWYGSM